MYDILVLFLEGEFKAKHTRLRFPVYDKVYEALKSGELDKPKSCEQCGRETEYHFGSKLPPKGSLVAPMLGAITSFPLLADVKPP